MSKNLNETLGYKTVLLTMLQNYVFVESKPMYSDKETKVLLNNDLVIHILFAYHMQKGYIADEQHAYITEVSLGKHKG